MTSCTYHCMYEIVYTVRKLYSIYFCSHFVLTIIWFSVEIIVRETNGRNEKRLLFVFFQSYLLFDGSMVVLMCETITWELRRLQATFNRQYYKQGMKHLRNGILIYHSAHQDQYFNCGVFELNFALLVIVCDFVSLLVFAMWGSCK